MSTPSDPQSSSDDPSPSPPAWSVPASPPAPPYAYNPAPPPQQPPMYAGQPVYPPPYYQYPPPQRTNGFAIASMVLGILWLYWVGSILALIFGYVARSQIRERRESGDGMAIAGIVLGWVGVGALAIFLVVIIIAATTATYR